MNENEIRIKVSGGYIVARRNTDPDYDGVYVVFETDNGDIIDIVLTECTAQNDYKKIDVYTYEDIYTEDFTRKFTLDNNKICRVLNG
jgi:hypothetical protein